MSLSLTRMPFTILRSISDKQRDYLVRVIELKASFSALFVSNGPNISTVSEDTRSFHLSTVLSSKNNRSLSGSNLLSVPEYCE
jgi:hypothetical protein